MEHAVDTRRPHERLDVWRDAIELAVALYRYTARLPESERFGLVSQLRRAAVSIPSNIAEGAARRSTSTYLHFLGIARGSLSELDTQLILCARLWNVEADEHLHSLVERTFARLNALIVALQRRVSEAAPDDLPEPAFSESQIPNPESHAR